MKKKGIRLSYERSRIEYLYLNKGEYTELLNRIKKAQDIAAI